MIEQTIVILENDTTDLHAAATAARRSSLLRAGLAWEEQGLNNSAMDAYFRLLKEYRGSPESRAASERLFVIGNLFEEQGHYHEALSLFDKVERMA
jgi:tetratricopeptide (TPR) repeat protein